MSKSKKDGVGIGKYLSTGLIAGSYLGSPYFSHANEISKTDRSRVGNVNSIINAIDKNDKEQTQEAIALLNGEDITLKNKNGQTILHLSIENDADIKAIETLINKDVDSSYEIGNYQDAEGKIPLHYAIKSGNTEAVKLLLEKYPVDWIKIQDNDGKTAVHYACENGNVEIANMIVEKLLKTYPPYLDEKTYLKTNNDWVTTKDKKGYDPLDYAIINGNEEIVKLLLDKAIVYTMTSRASRDNLFSLQNPITSETPVHLALKNGNGKILKLLLGNKIIKTYSDMGEKGGINVLHRAVIEGDLDNLKSLVDYNIFYPYTDSSWEVYIMSEDKKGKLPIDYAAEKGNEDIFNFLLPLSRRNRYRNSKNTLEYAVENGNLKIVSAILNDETYKEKFKNQKSLFTVNHYPVHLAAKNGNFEVFNLLLKNGYSFDLVETSTGKFPLHYAAEKGNLEILNFLLTEYPSALNKKDNSGRMPIHYAAMNNNIGAVEALIEKGAYTSIQDNRCKSPIDYAINAGNLEMANLLLDKGGSILSLKTLRFILDETIDTATSPEKLFYTAIISLLLTIRKTYNNNKKLLEEKDIVEKIISFIGEKNARNISTDKDYFNKCNKCKNSYNKKCMFFVPCGHHVDINCINKSRPKSCPVCNANVYIYMDCDIIKDIVYRYFKELDSKKKVDSGRRRKTKSQRRRSKSRGRKKSKSQRRR